jgi:phage recombination protein Bet
MDDTKKAGGKTSTALARRKTSELQKFEFDADTVEIIKRQIAPNASDNELSLFLYQCQRTGLDPLTRQIYCIHRGGKMIVQTSIDGFRVIAERSGSYAGQDEPEFYYGPDKKLFYCKVRVFKFGPGNVRYQAAVGVAYWSEYVQTSPTWVKMPHVMLSKVAEALALRKAFPQDLSGLYTDDELTAEAQSAFSVEIEKSDANKPPLSTPVNIKREEAVATGNIEEAEVLSETPNKAPEPPQVPAEVLTPWEYCEARKTIARHLLTFSKFEPGTDAYLNIYKYIYETDGARMNQKTYEGIKANLIKAENVKGDATPLQVKTAIKDALGHKGLKNPDARPNPDPKEEVKP